MGDHHEKPDVYQSERDQAKQQIENVDVARTGLMGGIAAVNPMAVAQGVSFGRTNFESHQLNEMKDMVDSASPEHLEDAGKALWEARDAIHTAAEELSGHIARIDWHGEAASAFHAWAGNLVTNAYALGDYADNAGTHITAASTGLVSVRKSMPPHDTRLTPMGVHDFPLVTQVAGNKDYQAAVTVEKHRQEAINQMNRLASYYSVTEESLRGEQAPTFGKMPDMGVPQARAKSIHIGGGDETSPSRAPEVGNAEPVKHHSVAATAGPDTGETPAPGKKLHDVVIAPDRHVHTDPSQHVGTDIDSVKILPPDTATSTAPVTPPTAPAPSGGGGGPISPVPTGPLPQTVGLPIGRRGAGGPRGPVVTPPRMTPPAGQLRRVGGGTGRSPVGPVGRPAMPGQAGARETVSPVGKAPLGEAPVGKAPVSRNVVGGTPRPVGVPAERMGGTGPTSAARTSGVVGGKPTTPPAQAVNGSKVPRGTVIGGETSSRNPRAIERPGQRGVIRAPEQEGDAQAPRRPVTPTGGVVGTPNSKASTARNGGRASEETVQGRTSAVNRGSARDGDGKKSRRRQSPETE
ncbi:hypothetical protein AV521_26810 [Streptomyces sp. IMTB 2501]|uniref:hypothetical protein n=1 Tax=Streptomyces sp. IMTB 2501 TaxID=1776340 RepID=UPI00096E8DF8|nr:hypothetical protein [Streptomyces sp. IMTB 2501]OLZ66993.1 hypothetical protein AV521_26810 [Streptomyces sp. IMTB 2501]